MKEVEEELETLRLGGGARPREPPEAVVAVDAARASGVLVSPASARLAWTNLAIEVSRK